MYAFQTLALFMHPNMTFDHPVFEEISHIAHVRGVNVVVCNHFGSDRPPFPTKPVNMLEEQSTLAVVLGGDGSFLHGAYALYKKDIPILGVNFGTVGFLTDTNSDDTFATLCEVLEGNYHIEERPYFLATAAGYETFPFVNEVVINRHPHDPPVDIDVTVGGEQVFKDCQGDGMLFSSPTGSTGYNRSAAGPVMHPSQETLSLTPICTQSRAARPLVVPYHMEVIATINRVGVERALLSFDGRKAPLDKLLPKETLVIRRSPHNFKLVQTKRMSYFERYQQKLT